MILVLFKIFLQNLTKDLENGIQQSFEKKVIDLQMQEMALLYDLRKAVTHFMPILAKARTLNLAAVDKWFDGIMDELRVAGKILPHVKGCPPAAAIKMRETPLPTLAERGMFSLYCRVVTIMHHIGLSIEQSTAFDLFDRSPAEPSSMDGIMESQLQANKNNLKSFSEFHLSHLKDVTQLVVSFVCTPRSVIGVSLPRSGWV